MQNPMGKFIYNICKDRRFKHYVETGSKNGDGSTYCFVKGLLTRNDDYTFRGYETKKEFHRNAVRNLRRESSIDPKKIAVLNQSLVSYEELPVFTDHPSKSYRGKEPMQRYHYHNDMKQATTAEELSDIDVMLLDSGAWSRQAEWNKYKDRVKVIILDDTKVSTGFIREEILNSPKVWHVLHDDQKTRNGWLAAERKA